jgi:hypothetical protein
MRNQKDFDCVEMKQEIQQRLLEEFRGMDREEACRVQQERIAADPLLKPFLEGVALSVPIAAPSHS